MKLTDARVELLAWANAMLGKRRIGASESAIRAAYAIRELGPNAGFDQVQKVNERHAYPLEIQCGECGDKIRYGVLLGVGGDEVCAKCLREALALIPEDNSAENRQRIAEDADFDRHTDNKIVK
jgi:hypothetical protein